MFEKTSTHHFLFINLTCWGGAENVFAFWPTTDTGIIPTIPWSTGWTGEAIIMADPKKTTKFNKIRFLWMNVRNKNDY